ncbi:MAG: 50S ribosomal protein L4 [Candidatus Omnitrophica bacterium]|nr:50S ribosomal protein L4 [Candidatus Omnitrophota bacterium]
MQKTTKKTEKTEKIGKIEIIGQDGKKIQDLELNPKIFDGYVNIPLLHEAVVMYNANKRLGTQSAKTRAEVSGGGKKPWRQKGTGRARAGSTRSPLWRHGGVIFAPKPRNYYYRMPKKAILEALRCALNDKINEKKLVMLEKIEISSCKTKDFVSILNKINAGADSGRILLVTGSTSDNLKLASGNIRNINVITGANVNAHLILLADKVIMEKEAFLNIEKRLK